MKADAKKGLLISTVLLIAFSASGCASTPGSITPITQLKEGVKLANFSNLSIEVKHADDVSMMSTDRERILNLLIARIKKEAPGRFKEINSSTPGPSTLHISVNVTRYEKGSAFARFMLAGLGQIKIDAQVVLEDREKQEPLGRYEVTKTFAWGGIYGGATRIEDVEEGFTTAIVDLLLKQALEASRPQLQPDQTASAPSTVTAALPASQEKKRWVKVVSAEAEIFETKPEKGVVAAVLELAKRGDTLEYTGQKEYRGGSYVRSGTYLEVKNREGKLGWIHEADVVESSRD
ncbi:MAG: DUF4410 domain-containing protein [Candidatus Rokubacteria bacterium]|nr:DUF4410 domain-containing protein [Candidatus Rokubacteria bacterium]